MKKLLSVVLCVLMLLNLCACGEDNEVSSVVNNSPATSTLESKEDTSSSEVSSETSSGDIAEEKLFVRGEVTDGVYTNEFAGVRFTAPAGMEFFSDEDIAAVYGASEEMFDITLDTSLVYDMYASNVETGATININYENMGLLYGMLLDADAYLSQSMGGLEDVFNSTDGMSVVSIEKSTVTVSGTAMPCINLVVDIGVDGASLYETLIAKKVDNYMMVCTFGALTTEEIDTMVACLENF